MSIKDIFQLFERKPPISYGIGAKFQLKNGMWMKHGAMPTIDQSGIKGNNVFIAECCIMVVTKEDCKKVELQVFTNNCAASKLPTMPKNKELVWMEKDLFNNFEFK